MYETRRDILPVLHRLALVVIGWAIGHWGSEVTGVTVPSLLSQWSTAASSDIDVSYVIKTSRESQTWWFITGVQSTGILARLTGGRTRGVLIFVCQHSGTEEKLHMWVNIYVYIFDLLTFHIPRLGMLRTYSIYVYMNLSWHIIKLIRIRYAFA